ncbi:MAG: hypothetical protein ACREF4_01950 [Gammaproteobacteria bacterium]
MLRVFFGLLVAALALGVAVSADANREAAADIQPRVDHHIRELGVLVQHFEAFIVAECPRFATVAEWNAYAEGEIESILLMVAHAEQAWVEAKRTGDDDVRRSAKAPRRRLDEAPQILHKLVTCAESNGARLSPGSVVSRIERELPRRQSEIALPR